MRQFLWVCGFFSSAIGAFLSCNLAQAVPITLFHTNDLHSHFRPEKTPLALGGIARLKTLINRARKEKPNSLLVDGGDWSEGNIYYTEGAGREVLHMMDHLGYDIALIGNHDWLNGPDTLLDAIVAAQPKLTLIGSNFDTSEYSREAEFRKYILPSTIKTINGVKIAFIGMATYEFIYDHYMYPIKMIEPFRLAREMAQQLKTQADAVVVISHNRVYYNQGLLQAAPEIDLVIGAHDHVALTKPVVVKREGYRDGWVVEAGCWGRFLGEVDLDITPGLKGTTDSVKLLNYKLTQVDKTIPNDPETLAQLVDLEKHIETRMGPVFHDHLGDTQVELSRDGSESPLGDFETAAYKKATGADVALDVKGFIYGNIHHGAITSADVFNAMPAVPDPSTGKTWTVQLASVQGSDLSLMIKLLLSKAAPFSNGLFMTGVSTSYSPESGTENLAITDASSSQVPTFGLLAELLKSNAPTADHGTVNPGAYRILVDGAPIDLKRYYKVAAGRGIFETFTYLNSVLPGLIPDFGHQDTGIEGWRIVANSIRELTPITSAKVGVGTRLQSDQANLRVFYDDITWTPIKKTGKIMQAQLSVRVQNYGASQSDRTGSEMDLGINKNGNNTAVEADWTKIGTPIIIPSLRPGESKVFTQTIELTEDRGAYSVNLRLIQNMGGTVASDNVTRYF